MLANRFLFLVLLSFTSSILWSSGAWQKFRPQKKVDLLSVEKEAFKNLQHKKIAQPFRPELVKQIFIRIFKESKELEVWILEEGSSNYRLLKNYPICTYSGDLGPKVKEGDKQAPEGFYRVYLSSLNPNSSYHLSFNLGFPNEYDRAHGRTGSYLMVHGNCVSIGCYAMTDPYIEEIYSLAKLALEQPQNKFFSVHIFPFRMTAERLDQEKNNQWYEFWSNLKAGYDLFEKNKTPPNVKVQNKKYVF